jgi:hypothetical protein
MINKIKGNWYIICDGCSDNEDFLTFEAALNYAKENNWTVEKNDKDEWENYCIDCQELEDYCADCREDI